MHHAANRNPVFHLWLPLALAATAVTAGFIWQGHLRFNLQDESYLWYGVQRVLQGEVPLRDFMAYDPGRYYWSAAFLHLLGTDSIMALRMSMAVFQCCGLAIGIALVASNIRLQDRPAYGFLALTAMILIIWMFPRHKLFDISTSLFLLGGLYLLFKHPDGKRHFFLGLCVGLAAVIGRNHGVYGLLASGLAIAWLGAGHGSTLQLVRHYGYWCLGILAGFSPVLFMAAVIPGFAQAFGDSVIFLFQIGATNIPLPVPWPWHVDNLALNTRGLRALVLGMCFVALPAGGIAALSWLWYCRSRGKPVAPAFSASAFLILPYAHVAFSRADIPHLAQAVFPLLVAALTLLAAASLRWRWAFTLPILLASGWLMYPVHPGGQCAHAHCVATEISGDRLRVTPKEAADVARIRQAMQAYAPEGGSFIATPLWPGAYALLGQKAPMWAIYNLFPQTPAFQKREIARMKAANPRFALVQNHALDAQENLRFELTNPLIYQYIKTHFTLVSRDTPSGDEMYRAKDSIQP